MGTPVRTGSNPVDPDVDVLMTEVVGQLPGYVHCSGLAHLVVVISFELIPSGMWILGNGIHCRPIENPLTYARRELNLGSTEQLARLSHSEEPAVRRVVNDAAHPSRRARYRFGEERQEGCGHEVERRSVREEGCRLFHSAGDLPMENWLGIY